MVAKLSSTFPNNANQRLETVYQQMSIDNQSDIPLIVRLFENPSSPIALPGKINLHDHDCLHILLGLGLTPQDEAFILGFTMGNDDRTKRWHIQFFKFLAQYIYPRKYQFNRHELNIFDLGFEYGQRLSYRNLNQVKFIWFYNLTIKEIRNMFGIDRQDYIGIF